MQMTNETIKVLLMEDNPGDVRLLREMLAQHKEGFFRIECADRLSTGLKRLAAGGIDVLLLDLSLPDSQGLDTFAEVHAQAPEVPVVVLTGLDDERFAVREVHEGAQDYLVKGQVDGPLLVRSLRYAIERQRLQTQLRSLSLVDELTGLHNRRGFLTLAAQYLKSARRANSKLLFVYADLDQLKQINDNFGHQAGDLALIKTAEILRETFRESDIVARIGGDEFVVLATEAASGSARFLTVRLQACLAAHNARADNQYKLSISMGIVRYDPQNPCSVDELLSQADALMYEQKKTKHLFPFKAT